MQTKRQAAVNPQTKPTDFACRLHLRHHYYYSARRLILICRPTEGRRLSQPRTRWFTRSWTVTHPSTNRARRRQLR